MREATLVIEIQLWKVRFKIRAICSNAEHAESPVPEHKYVYFLTNLNLFVL